MILNGEPVNSCLVLAVETDGSEVTTIEGIGAAGMTPLQESFLATGAIQCGFCIPGMVVAATALLGRIPRPIRARGQGGVVGQPLPVWGVLTDHAPR